MTIISHNIGAICMGVALNVGLLNAQTSRSTPKEIAEMVDAALLGVIPSDRSLTMYTVAERGIRFDHARTLAAFGYGGDGGARAAFSPRTPILSGTSELLSDCSQLGSKPCKLIGKAAYVFLEPISITRSDAVVSLHVTWASAVSPYTFMSSFATEVHLSRSEAGPWKFVRAGATIAS